MAQMLVGRFTENPLIAPGDVRPSRDDFEVVGTFNPGAFELDGRIGLLVDSGSVTFSEVRVAEIEPLQIPKSVR